MEDPAGPPPTIATSKSGLVITNDSSSFLRMILCHDAANPIRCGIDGPWRAESFCDMPVPSSGHYFCGDRFGSCFNDPGSPECGNRSAMATSLLDGSPPFLVLLRASLRERSTPKQRNRHELIVQRTARPERVRIRAGKRRVRRY